MTTQLSPLRKGRVTGSRVGPILGLSKFQTRDDVMCDLVREAHGIPTKFQGNAATNHGNLHEEDARSDFERLHGLLVLDSQDFFIHPEHDFLGVSVDGLVGAEEIVEFKAPYRARYASITEKPEYTAQVQLQMACTGRSAAWFVIWRSFHQADRLGVEPLIVERVEADREWLSTHLPALAAFHDEYLAIIADPTLAEPFLTDPIRTDLEWDDAETEYLEADAALDLAGKRMDAAKARLRELAGDRTAKGARVQVIRSERAGSVAYRDALEKYAPDADLDAFRKAASVVWTVKPVAR